MNSVKFKRKHRYPCKPKPLSLLYSFPRGARMSQIAASLPSAPPDVTGY